MKKFLSVRVILTVFLLLSLAFAGYSIFYKIKYWGFSFSPKQNANVWAIEANINFMADGSPIKVSLGIPSRNKAFKILEENTIADGYRHKRYGDRIVFQTRNHIGEQNLYYKIIVFDNSSVKAKLNDKAPKKPEMPTLDEQRMVQAKQILQLAKQMEGQDKVERLINLFNQEPLSPALQSYLPVKYTNKLKIKMIQELLAVSGTAARTARGLKLEEGQKITPDLMLEAYSNGAWHLYDIQTGQRGLPDNFLLFQRGGQSLLDVEGGTDSSVKFSIQKSITSTMNLASRRAKLSNKANWFNYSVYNLPLAQQNTLKWLSVFPIGILLVVLLRNVIGMQTMGTFTPMLLSMALVKTGFSTGLICFTAIILLGLCIRFVMSKLNLLLVPRISAVVIFVILIIHALTFVGYNFHIKIAQASVFFPIIITAWIIERASITWEEDGAWNAGRELFNSVIVGIIVYFVIANDYIRHIMFVFNELNLVILFIVMLLGTYTGYRLTELMRFAPLVKK
jgi:hypothetical protein